MKMEGGRRAYTMRARADAARATEQRILAVARERFTSRFYDEVTLADVAAAAGVTSQTVIRRFGSKDGLIAAVAEQATQEVRADRARAPAGDVPGAIANLVAHYEREGDNVLRLLAQEDRVPALKRIIDEGRRLHHDWVERVFAEKLAAVDAADRPRRRAQLIAVCDVYVWKVLRRDLGLSRDETETALTELLKAHLEGA